MPLSKIDVMDSKQKDLLETQIIELIAVEPQTLTSLVNLTQATSAQVSWICQNLRGQGIIDLNDDGLFCSSDPVKSVPAVIHPLPTKSLEHPQ